MLSKETKEKILLLVIILGIVLSIVLMSTFSNQTDFGDAALGKGTVSYYATDEYGQLIHYMPKKDVNNFISGIQKYNNLKTILFLGNSQSHSINQMKVGDNTMSGFLFEELLPDSILFLSASVPNANLQEQYLLYEYFRQRINKIDLIVLPVFFDDLREDGIREAYFGNFANGKFVLNKRNETAETVNQFLIKNYRVESEALVPEESVPESDFNALEETTQDRVEIKLNQLLFDRFQFWNNREELRGEFFTKLYLTRNTIFNISAQTTRNMIPSRYERNFNALKTIILRSIEDSIKVLLIIPPLRTDIKYPYNDSEYSSFKKDLNKLASENIRCIDLEKIVESEYWGYSAPTQLFKTFDYDFMHFQAKGHRVLADSIKPHILKFVR